MFSKIFIFAFFAIAFVQGHEELDVLENLIKEGDQKVWKTLEEIDVLVSHYEQFVSEKLECLLWETTAENETLNKTITEAVFKGMLKDKQYSSFQCISTNAQENILKLEKIISEISPNSNKIVVNGVSNLRAIRPIVQRLFRYLQDLSQKKTEEINKSKNENDRKKTLAEVEKKMKNLSAILDQVCSQSKAMKFKLMEDYIIFVFNTKNSVKNAQRDGSQKIMKCVA